MKRLLLILGIIFAMTLLPSSSAHAQTPVPLSIFGRESCGHCQDLKAFLAEDPELAPLVAITNYDVEEAAGRALFDRFTARFDLPQVTPIIFVGNRILVGFDNASGRGAQIRDLVKAGADQPLYTAEAYLQAVEAGQIKVDSNIVYELEQVRLPLIGTINVKQYSLTAMAMILGFVDGFNPCAMWVLVMFLTLLLQAGSRKRMFQLAGLFILAETIMYYAIMTVWITAWDFIGLDRIVTPLVGLVAVGAGAFFLYEYKRYRGACKVIKPDQKIKIKNRMQKLVNSPLTLVGIIGILGLAFSVNIIEFACSIGIPQAFTKILDLNNLDGLARQGYILIYILFYMVDDFIIFAGALYAFSRLDLASRYSQLSNLIGGILMLILGLILILVPKILVF